MENPVEMENPAEKRILKEYDEIESNSNPSKDFKFCKLDWNSYEWQGALRGPSGTEFEGGIYHVRLLFPKETPWEGPSFIFLTKNGSFNIETEVRLNWKPSWRMRDAFIELIELMRKCPHVKSDSVKHKNKKKRRRLAKKSRRGAPIFGTYERQKLMDVNHQYLGGETRNTPLTQRCEEEVVVDRVGPTQMESDQSVIVVDKCNIKNSGEKWIQEEYDYIKSNLSNEFTCLKLGWKNYEWQFAIRGPSGTEFDGGIYHGMVKFSEGYPSNPPSIAFLTKNGCFDTENIISLSNWQSSLSVRDTIVAFIEQMATYSNGGLVWCKRRHLAIKSRAKAPTYGTFARQEVMDEIHQHMLRSPPPVSVLFCSKWLEVFMVIVCAFCSYVMLQAAAVYVNIYYSTSSGRVVNVNISGITLNVNNSKWVGVFDFLKEAPNPKGITELFLVFMCFVMVLFVVWSY